jgi:hypothetical protein
LPFSSRGGGAPGHRAPSRRVGLRFRSTPPPAATHGSLASRSALRPTSLLRLAMRAAGPTPARDGHGSLASWRPLRVAYSLRLARARQRQCRPAPARFHRGHSLRNDQRATPRRSGPCTASPTAGHGSLASRQPIRVVSLLRLARADGEIAGPGHRLARIAVIPCGMTGLLRLAEAGHALHLQPPGTAPSRRDNPFGSSACYASRVPTAKSPTPAIGSLASRSFPAE